MLVKVNTSLAGADFDFRFGQEVEQEEFAARVGNGWETLCDPVVAATELAVEPAAEETADAESGSETTDAVPAAERRGRRK